MAKKPNSKTKKPQPKNKSTQPTSSTSSTTSSLPHETSTPGETTNEDVLPTQQKLINIFSRTFSNVLSLPNFSSILQQVKQHLFNRDFDAAFGTDEFLDVYAARWSPTRALCYASVFDEITPHLRSLVASPDDDLHVISIGGGAAETVALGAYLSSSPPNGHISLIDCAPWGNVITKLHGNLTTPPVLSKYASDAARAENQPLVPASRFSTSFHQHDILPLSEESLASLVCRSSQRPVLVTLNFTLNELFATSGGVGATTAFFLRLTAVIPPGSLLLVLDSPGSYSEASVGSTQKRYPMQWLLHKILSSMNDADAAASDERGEEEEEKQQVVWTRLETRDSVWFRLHEKLEYPIPLENMRYQMHLYRASKRSGA